MSALALELAKCLKLVAPATMTADAQTSWIASAVDALEGISAAEVAAVSAEIRRSITRPAQIVPEVARLVSESRHRRAKPAEEVDERAAATWSIERETRERRYAAKGQAEVEEVAVWERGARITAGLPVAPIAPPLSREELDEMPEHIASLGLKYGFLERENGKLFERIGTTGGR